MSDCRHSRMKFDVSAQTSLKNITFHVFGAQCEECKSSWDVGSLLQAIVNLAECEREIDRLPVPPEHVGDGPNERVSNVLSMLEDNRTRRHMNAAKVLSRNALLEDIAPELKLMDQFDENTAHAIANAIIENRVPSPWRDAGVRLAAFGEWLRNMASAKRKRDAESTRTS